jgi:hypothetical protein
VSPAVGIGRGDVGGMFRVSAATRLGVWMWIARISV